MAGMGSPETLPRLEIRPVRDDDAAAIREIFNEGVQDGLATFDIEPRSLQEQRQLLAEAVQDTKHPVLVAQLGRWVLGWIAIEPYDARPVLDDIGEVSVFVRRSFRKHGVGKQLMLAIQQEAHKRGYRKLLGRVLAENTDSLRLCRATGFREVGRHENHARSAGKLRDVVLVEYIVPGYCLKLPALGGQSSLRTTGRRAQRRDRGSPKR
jgi:phosphinothricin acetyltransferase